MEQVVTVEGRHLSVVVTTAGPGCTNPVAISCLWLTQQECVMLKHKTLLTVLH